MQKEVVLSKQELQDFYGEGVKSVPLWRLCQLVADPDMAIGKVQTVADHFGLG